MVVVPAGALAANVDIAIAESATGAPALPAGFVAAGPIYAFTPHGTGFASPATLTVPFDPAKVPAGSTPSLYKTNAAQSAFEALPNATVSGGTMSADVTGFSFAVVLVPDPTTQTSITHHWSVAVLRANGTTVDGIPYSTSTDQPVNQSYDLGPLYTRGILSDSTSALGDIYANLAGTTYWTDADAPHGDLQDPHARIGNHVYFDQTQTFVKTGDTASMELDITFSDLETMDYNPWLPTNTTGCFKATVTDNSGGSTDYYDCGNLLDASLSYQIYAWKKVPITDANGTVTGYGKLDLAHGTVFARLYGYIKGRYSPGTASPYANWHFDYGSIGDSNLWFGYPPQYNYNDNKDNNVDDTHAFATLSQDTLVEIPLDVVNKGDEFVVMVVASAIADNHRQYESYAGAYFRDPQKTKGLQIVSQGVTPVVTPIGADLSAPVVETLPAPACAGGTDPASGVLQFQTAALNASEGSSAGMTPVWVTRSGGGSGEASVRVATHDGSAHAGTDYNAVSMIVHFANGEQGQRYVPVPLINNETLDAERTLTLTMSELSGCAALGAPTTATLSIVDDELPPPAATYTLGGTVSGLSGTGLTLQTGSGDQVQPTANGSFTFPTALTNGSTYSVSVLTQPVNPAQYCVLSHGSGTIAGANVSDIGVACTTVLATGSLDPAFATGGKYSGTASAGKSVALQADGKIVTVGGMTLSRFNSDGSVDTTFGTAGKVTLVAGGGAFEAMEAVAVQGDGKIVVAGHTSTPPSLLQDFALQRFNADGSLDGSFGSGGKLLTDFAGSEDAAYALVLQPDGKIVVAGLATAGTGVNANQDMAVARYLVNGTLDAGFGTGGKATLNVAGPADFGYGVALQGDGAIVVAGRVATNGGTDPDFGVVRFDTSGHPDAGFGTGGALQIAFAPGVWDEAGDVLVQGDGRIVLGGYTRVGASYQYAVLRLNADGTPDTGFGANGRVSTSLASGDNFGRALALQTNGDIVVAGQVSSLQNGNFGVLRLLPDGSADSTFGTAGLVTIDFFGANDAARDLAIQQDGRILVVGSAVNGSAGLAMARIAP